MSVTRREATPVEAVHPAPSPERGTGGEVILSVEAVSKVYHI